MLLYWAMAPIIKDLTATRDTLDACPDIVVVGVISHGASLLDVDEFFPAADLTVWEKRGYSGLSRKKNWEFLCDFRRVVLEEHDEMEAVASGYYVVYRIRTKAAPRTCNVIMTKCDCWTYR